MRRRKYSRDHDAREQKQPADRDRQTGADPVYNTAPGHGEEGRKKRKKTDQQTNGERSIAVGERVKARSNAHDRKGHVKRNGKENDAENHGIT